MPQTPASSTPIDTRRVRPRVLRFEKLEQAVAEAERLAAADAAGRVRVLGNWGVGQSFGHLAYWIDAAFDGYPIRPPWLLRKLGPLMKNRMLRGPLPKGVRLPKAPGGTFGVDVWPTAEGLDRFRAAVRRLQTTCPQGPNPVFGPLTHAEWQQVHLRHAEHHLGFLVAQGDPVP